MMMRLLAIAHELAWALQDMGRYAAARDLAQDSLTRQPPVLGDDHPGTLISATQLAASLRAPRRGRMPPATWTRTP